MEISKLEDMTVVSSIELDEMICINKECPDAYRGKYINCYLHTHVYCPIFNEWFNHTYQNSEPDI